MSGRQSVAPGVSPGYVCQTIALAPSGAKEDFYFDSTLHKPSVARFAGSHDF
jgi:hypothetical protein